MKSSLTSTAAGIAVAIIGLLPLFWVMNTSHAEQPAASEPIAVAVPSPTTTVTTTIPEPVVVTIEPTTPKLEGIGDAATRVLYANGYAQYTAPADVGDELPSSVVQLLIDRGVTLTVAVETADQDTP